MLESKLSPTSKDISFGPMEVSLNSTLKSPNALDGNTCYTDIAQNEETNNRSNTVIVNINFKSKRLLREEFDESKQTDFENNKFEDKKLLNL